jgi:CHASE3 domain sensor protein
MRDIFDYSLIGFCFLLVLMAGIFLGHEINMIQTSAKLRQAQHTVEKCQYIITKGELYENIN